MTEAEALDTPYDEIPQDIQIELWLSDALDEAIERVADEFGIHWRAVDQQLQQATPAGTTPRDSIRAAAKLVKERVQGCRYYVTSIGGSGVGIKALSSTVIDGSDDAAEAKEIAERFADEYTYGTAVVDTVERTIDWGDEVTGW